ncbi:phospholipase D-like domain-containing protein [Alysiella crassa]|uniref:Cardiolipin synthase n=1 Tax=Alysiella crassa TaxID=153491 RepID=A0A376BVE7_9NEIS|nr:phosphatidylserine/phosphatidylglycerophosphate/cardiolipin synthase family protein [Alysiella crassa]UOP06375.1 phosphatidylserine/phosphatidylglycerophosphate/cardiolipin synthase family protein [Alysiella crassa]SSY80889.1 Cardiolipin synthase [Alysiella crassa]
MNTNKILEQLRLRSSSTEIRANHEIKILNDSGENFPEWLAAIEAAQKYILIEMYIFADNEFGKQMRDLLIQKQKSGVKVVLVYDWLGSLIPVFKKFFKPLEDAGALVVAYNPVGFASGLGLLSRNHRKSFVIDGEVAFVSGLCVSSAWNGNAAKNEAAWRDIGVKIQGEAVFDVMVALADTLTSQGHELPEEVVLPAFGSDTDSGSLKAGVVATTPRDNNMMRLDLNAISLANKNLWITDAYFMPTRLYTQTLINAAHAGVDVRILVPKTSDIAWIARVSRTRYRELLQVGVRVFEWNGTMIHAKSAIVDGVWARVGSTNLNFSSWHLNRELDVVLHAPEVIADLERAFLADLENATEIVLNNIDFANMKRQRRLHLKQLKALNRSQAQAISLQIMNLSQAFKGNWHNTATTLVEEREINAYLGLGITLLLFALILWFLPYILIVPLMILLVAGGVSTLIYAVKQRRKFLQNQSAGKQERRE